MKPLEWIYAVMIGLPADFWFDHYETRRLSYSTKWYFLQNILVLAWDIILVLMFIGLGVTVLASAVAVGMYVVVILPLTATLYLYEYIRK